MPQGKIKFISLDKQFGFISQQNGGDVHFSFHALVSSLRPQDLKPDLAVEFEIVAGHKGPTAANVRAAGSQSAHQPQQAVAHQEKTAALNDAYFLNPYNFVRYLPEPQSLNKDGEAALLWRCEPQPHDQPVGLHGKITCTLTAQTPLFVSDGKPSGVVNGHPTYKFNSENNVKVIPGSGVRGTVRTVFEAITNSCFATINNKPLSYRLGPNLAGFLVPARVEEKNDVWGLRLLTGTAQLSTSQKPTELYPASIRLYKALRPSGKFVNNRPQPPVDLSSFGSVKHPSELHKTACWAVLLRMKFPPAYRVIAVAPDQAQANLALQKIKNSLPSGVNTVIKPGYLCITNQNIDNKASDRFFFEGGTGGPKVIPLSEDVRLKYSDLIGDYQDRHKDEVDQRKKAHLDPKIPVPGSRDEPGFSRFILNREDRYLQDGDLVYAMLRGTWPNVQLEFIAPVSIPRVAYQRGPADLLPKHLQHCKSYEALCPACRTFGWIKDEGSEPDEKSAYRGRVQFSSAACEKSVPLPPMRLSILGSPKPTTTRFYLVDPAGKAGRGRSDEAVGYDGNDGKNRLRGRKIYRNFRMDNRFALSDTTSSQNRTVEDPEGVGSQFKFTVRFDNLFPAELGALLWALTLGGLGVHKFGLGKPLGLGSAAVVVDSLEIKDLQQWYRSVDLQAGVSHEEDRDPYIQSFQKEIVRLYSSEAHSKPDADITKLFLDLDPVKDLLSLVGNELPRLSVHYPFSPEPGSKGSFEWFVGNKRVNGPRRELDLAAEDHGLPFINKRGDEL